MTGSHRSSREDLAAAGRLALLPRGAVMGDTIVDRSMREDPRYAPYCMRCAGLQRMRRVSPTAVKCPIYTRQ